MTTQNEQGYPVLIVGAGRGGCALLEMFLENSMVKVIAIVDPNLSAPGIKLAKEHGIPNYAYVTEALHICKNYPDCIVYNLSHYYSVD